MILFRIYLESIWNLFGIKREKSANKHCEMVKKHLPLLHYFFAILHTQHQILTVHHLYIMPKIIGDLRLYDLDELSNLLGMHKKSLTDKYIKTGVIRARKFGVRWYVPEDALKEYFAGKEETMPSLVHAPLQAAQQVAQQRRSQTIKHLP